MSNNLNLDSQPKKLIIFDFDGVIGDTIYQAYLATNEVLEKYDLQAFDTPEEFYEDLNVTLAVAPKLIWNRIKKHGFFGGFLGIIKHLTALSKIKSNLMFAFGPKLIAATYFVGIPDVLEKLQGQAEMVIVSNNQKDGINKFLEKNNLAKYFTEVHGFEKTMVKTGKLKKIMESRKTELANVIFITDMARDVNDANPLKLRCLAVTYGYNNLQKLQTRNPAKIIDRVDQILPALKTMLFLENRKDL